MRSASLLVCIVGLSAFGVTVSARTAPKVDPVTYVLAIFGDSLTDNGNTLRAGGVPDPTLYYKGRFTNGPNWVDFLNATLSKKHKVKVMNYAWGGASACYDNVTSSYFPYVKHLEAQTADFAADVASGKIPSGKNVRILPIQMVGGNDIMFGLAPAAKGVFPTQAELQALVARTIGCRVQALQAAASLPGVKDAVMVPMAPIYLAPAAPAALKPFLKQLLDGIDAETAKAVAALQAPLEAGGKRVHHLGDNSWMERGAALVRPPFKNMTDPCFWNPGTTMRISPGLKPCPDPRNYLFYDDTHISSRYHEWFAVKGLLPRLQQLRLLPAKA